MPVTSEFKKPVIVAFRLSDEIIASLRQRIDARYYDQPQVIETIARAILCSRGVYLT